MAQKCGFFDAVVNNGVPDRSYTAADFNNFFKGILSDGVFQYVDNALIVTAGASGLTVTVGTGKALVNKRWYTNDTAVTLNLAAAHGTLNRYTSVVLRYTENERKIELAMLDGVNATDPVAPALTQNESTFEILLAKVYVGAGVTSILSSNITDGRNYVSGLVDPTPLAYRRYDYTVANATGESSFNLPSSYNYTPNTKLQVFDNGLMCMESEYTIQINEAAGNYMVVFPAVRANGSEMAFIMLN